MTRDLAYLIWQMLIVFALIASLYALTYTFFLVTP